MATERSLDIRLASIDQLKASAYDQIVQVQRGQNTLAFIEKELQRRHEVDMAASSKEVVVDSPVVVVAEVETAPA